VWVGKLLCEPLSGFDKLVDNHGIDISVRGFQMV
jgi:hypothetical protein